MFCRAKDLNLLLLSASFNGRKAGRWRRSLADSPELVRIRLAINASRLFRVKSGDSRILNKFDGRERTTVAKLPTGFERVKTLRLLDGSTERIMPVVLRRGAISRFRCLDFRPNPAVFHLDMLRQIFRAVCKI